MNVIEIRDLSKSFRGMFAVDHLNMTVPVGALIEDPDCACAWLLCRRHPV